MTGLPAACATALTALLFASPTLAQRLRLDDSLSPAPSYPVELTWSHAEISRALQAMLLGETAPTPRAAGVAPNVEVRLKTSEFLGRRVRIYLSLPIPSSGLGGAFDVELRWETRGKFLPGAVRPGQSTLVFEGILDEPVTSVVFDFVVALENGAAADPFDLEPVYEIELLP